MESREELIDHMARSLYVPPEVLEGVAKPTGYWDAEPWQQEAWDRIQEAIKSDRFLAEVQAYLDSAFGPEKYVVSYATEEADV